VALHLGTGPIRRIDDDASRAPATSEPAAMPYEIGQPDPATLGGAAATLSDLPRMPMTTVPGLPPPPIPVPPGLGPPSIPPPPGASSSTLLGMGKTPPPAIPVKSRPGSVAWIPPVPPGARRASTKSELDPTAPLEPPPTTTTESAVHTLDPSDLLSIDALPEELEPRTDAADAPPAAPDAPAPVDGDAPAAATPDAAPAAAELPAASSADDFQDAPTHSLGRSAAAAAAARAAAGKAKTRYPLDPSSIDTKPIPPVTLEPLLFDPIPRPD